MKLQFVQIQRIIFFKDFCFFNSTFWTRIIIISIDIIIKPVAFEMFNRTTINTFTDNNQ